MARNVEDLALLLDAMSGEHPADPLSLPALPTSFLSAARSGKGPKRVAYSPDLGITPVDPEVAAITAKAAARFAEAGAIVEEAHPDLREAHECFHVLRAFDFAISKAALLRTKRDLLKPEVIWNIEEGLKLTVEQLERAEAQRVAMTARTRRVFPHLRSAAGAGDHRRAVSDRKPLCRRMRRQEIRQLCRMARHRLCHYAGLLPGAVAALRIHRIGPAGRTADGGRAARRGPASRRRQGAGGYSGRARHHADRSETGEVADAAGQKTVIWTLADGFPHRYNRLETHVATKRDDKGTLEMSGKLKIHVDQDKCQGHARCKSLAPELFELDEFGNAHEVGDGSVPAGLEDKAWLAKANCPEIAIEVTEE